MNFFYQVAFSLAVMLAFAIIPLFIYAIRSCGVEGFTWKGFFTTNRVRFLLGFVLMAWIALLVTLQPESRKVLSYAVNFIATFIGIGGGSTAEFGVSDSAIGLIVGGLLIAAISGRKA